MPDYERMYHSLFRDVTGVIDRLQEAQRKTEQIYLESKDMTFMLLKCGPEQKKQGPSFDEER